MNASAVGKMIVEVDRAYLAGLVDGDGCIMATIERHSEKKFGFRVRVTFKITQKESGLLLSLAKQFCMGKVSKNRTTFDWEIKKRDDVWKILDIMEPYMRAKRKQVVLAKKILSLSDATKKGLLLQARTADALSKFNVRSFGRRTNFVSMI